MKFSTREDIEAPIDHVFGRVSDFAGFERQALRRGGEIRRLDKAPEPQVGSAWDVSFQFRGKERKMTAHLVQLEAPSAMQIDTKSSGIDGETKVELVALSRTRTRLAITMELKPKSLSARLLIQSLKLAKSNLSRKFKLRIADFAEDTETRYKRQS